MINTMNLNKVEVYVISTPEGQVEYSYNKYSGAYEFHYKWKHIPTGKTGVNTIYGLSYKNGWKLLRYWNKQQPNNWFYLPN